MARRSWQLADKLWFAGAIALSLLVGVQAVAAANADNGISRLVILLNSGSSDHLASRAQRGLDQGKPERSLEFARQAVSRSPLNQAAVRAYGLAEIARGDKAAGGVAMRAAAGLGWRDSRTQLWLLQDDFTAGRTESGFKHADALARKVGMGPEVFQLFAYFLKTPELKASLLQRLTENPGWRGDFFGNAPLVKPDDLPEFANLLSALKAKNSPPTRPEILPVLGALVQAGQVTMAQTLYQQLLPQDAKKAGADPFGIALSLVGEGDSESGVTPFDWRLFATRGTSVSIEPSGDAGDLKLFVSTSGNRRLILAYKLLALRPGDYKFTYRLASDDKLATTRLSWSAECLTAGGTSTPNDLAATSLGQDRYLISFTVPSSDCIGQRIRLMTNRGLDGATVAAEIDELQITR